MSTNECIAELLLRGLDDWVDATEVAWVAKAVGGARGEREVRDLAFRIIEQLLGENLMIVGMVTETGFNAWTVPANEALGRIKGEWRALPQGPGLGEICWLSLTKEGARRANELWIKQDTQAPAEE